MKKLYTAIILILILAIFSIFVYQNGKTKEVLSVISPIKIGIDLDNNKIITQNEIICIADIESFSLEPTEEFVNKYSKKFNLSLSDIISIGYLAQEQAQKQLLNQKVSIKFTPKVTNECQYANIKVNNVDYATLLEHSGYGIKGEEITETTKFKQNLDQARKLNLVVLNHHSNKYHKLDCEYADLAHDKIIIPLKQIPEDSIPCKFCHEKNKKITKINNQQIYNIPNLKVPNLIESTGDIILYHTNFTQHLKPDSKCQTNECKAIINLINNANETIDIAVYGYDEVPAVTQALRNAKNRGINIRFIYDEAYNPNETFYASNNIIKEIATEHVSDRNANPTKSNMLMHNKFIISDNKTVLTGSMNFSKTGLSGYDQNDVIIINSKEIANLYKKEFEQMLSGKFHTDKKKHESPNVFQLGNTILEIYFSPQDRSSKRIIELINNANSYIYIPTFLITHQKISDALISAHKRGVDVKIIIDANSTSTKNTKHNTLRNNGIQLKTENYAGKLHSKSMIIDGEYLIIGSMNFSNSGENRNDENMIVIKDKNIAKNYTELFQYLWSIIPNKYLKYNAKAESPDSIGSCSDGIDNNFNGKTDIEDDGCKTK